MRGDGFFWDHFFLIRVSDFKLLVLSLLMMEPTKKLTILYMTF